MNLQNLVDYCEEFQFEDIFSGVSVPEPLDPEDVKSAIMIKCGLMTPVYNDPTTFRNMCKFWFKSHKWNIEHLIKILLADYSPIENYDRFEDITINRTNKETQSGEDETIASGDDSVTYGKTDTTQYGKSDTTQYGKSDTNQYGHNIENQVSAFNSSTYSNSEKEIHSGSDVNTLSGSDVNTLSGTDTTNYGKIDTTTYGKITDNAGEDKTKAHIHGNIGVTTNQQMINQELELLKSFNIYEWIASRFEDDLFLTVY